MKGLFYLGFSPLEVNSGSIQSPQAETDVEVHPPGLSGQHEPGTKSLTNLAWGGIFFLVPYMTDALHLLDEWQEILLLCCD